MGDISGITSSATGTAVDGDLLLKKFFAEVSKIERDNEVNRQIDKGFLSASIDPGLVLTGFRFIIKEDMTGMLDTEEKYRGCCEDDYLFYPRCNEVAKDYRITTFTDEKYGDDDDGTWSEDEETCSEDDGRYRSPLDSLPMDPTEGYRSFASAQNTPRYSDRL
ncbi:recombination activating protein 1 [Striga asiatica]|uniref:Recombination activating protein 1 n=1 Tax=Striga asiatica TaxID=4170 RepID=A0A5A7PHA5_STRAF|nr:recombination activating protein 1 [Striga asiatica]